IEHKDGTLDTFYAHLSQALVESGDWVEQGTVIGHVGTTGYSTGPHLHFEVRRLSAEGSVEVDPMVELGPAPTYANQTVSTAPEEPEPAAAEPVPSVQPSPEYSVARISEVKSLDSRISVAPVEPASSAAQPQASPAAQNISVAAASASPPAAAPQPIVPDRISTLKLEDLDRWSNLCRSQMASDQYAEALAACNRTIALQPANLDLWMMRGQILEKLGRPSEAAAVYSYVLQRQPQHAEAQRLRGLALLASDKLAKEKMTQP
ncbi:MAG TPA: tetratricopeptide repeat protein, partial [Trichocoleus sp.]